MKQLNRALLPLLITSILSAGAWAQDSDEADECVEIEGTPPGMYTTTDEGHTYIIKDGKTVDLGPGQTGFADENEAKCIRKPPEFLDWPCATDAAQSRMFNTYRVSDLSPDKDKLQQIVNRYFQIPEVLSPIPNWIDGEYNEIFNYNEIIQFSSPEYWYIPDTSQPILSGKRPKSLLISLFVGTHQVVIDNYVIDALRKELGTDQMPVAFVFNDSNSVPISYFGANVSLEEIHKAFNERAIKVAEVPMWWQGDHHLKPTLAEFRKYFEVPDVEDVRADKRDAFKADLEAYGFSRKPFIVSLFADTGTMALDQPDRLAVAASMGMTSFPTALFFIEQDVLVARCGPGTPVGSSGVSGASTPIGGATVPPDAPVAPPPTEPEASDS